jgi:transcriptional regulator with XRE-family HTH domain
MDVIRNSPEIGARLLKARLDARMTQEEVVAKIGGCQTIIVNMEKGRNVRYFRYKIKQLAELYGVTEEALLLGVPDTSEDVLAKDGQSYTDIAQAFRHCVSGESCETCPRYGKAGEPGRYKSRFGCSAKLLNDAADALERLAGMRQAIEKLVEQTCRD